MNQYWKQFANAVNNRSMQERIMLLAAVVVVMLYTLYVFLIEPMQIEADSLSGRIVTVKREIFEELNTQAEIQATYSDDPSAFQRDRQSELRQQLTESNRELTGLYGQLIDPREMAVALANLDDQDSITVVSLKNLPEQLVVSSAVNGGEQDIGVGVQGSVEIYRHGMSMEIEGSFLNVVKFLRRLEEKDANFFWESLSYTVTAYPLARIKINIYTLSTQKGWLGV